MRTARRHPERATAKRPEVSVRAALLLVATALVVGCVPSSGKSGVPGELDVALFQAPTELVFSQRVTVGSRFDVFVVGRRTDDEARVLESPVTSSDDGVLSVVASELVEEGEGDEAIQRRRVTVELVGRGEAALVLGGEGADAVDRIVLRAAEPKRLELLDGTLLGSVVDTRSPERFSLVDRSEVFFVVGATDRCGAGVLDLGGVLVEALDPASSEELPLTTPYLTAVRSDETGAWLATPSLPDDDPLAPRETLLQLSAPGLAEPVRYEVKVAPASAVDEVDVAVAAAEPGKATLWGRAFTDDLEVLGLSFDWSSNARVTLDPSEGPMTIATISFPAEGEPADERPALVTAEVFGTEEDLDLLTLQDESALKTGRVPPVADETPAAPVGPSCGGDAATPCDPYQAAFVLGALFLGRRLKRRKRS